MWPETRWEQMEKRVDSMTMLPSHHPGHAPRRKDRLDIDAFLAAMLQQWSAQLGRVNELLKEAWHERQRTFAIDALSRARATRRLSQCPELSDKERRAIVEIIQEHGNNPNPIQWHEVIDPGGLTDRNNTRVM